MAEYIERDALFRKIDGEQFYDNADKNEIVLPLIDGFPAADVEPVRHGRWAESPIADGIDQCSQCSFMVSERNHYTYCPNCGAHMDVGA